MIKQISFLLILSLFTTIVAAQEILLKKGMVIKSSVRIKKQQYSISGFDSLEKGAIIIDGNNIVIDFNHAVLNGSRGNQAPDEFKGTAIVIRKGKNITIKNLSAKGYKVAILARDIQGLKIENCDFSYNYRQRLNSTQEKEDLSDWMSYHHNENDQWLRYGAAIYLSNCDNALVKNCRVTGGQNALMMVGCDNGLFYNNDFSFNSGIGIGMYQCNKNRVIFNKLNFNVRGYSEGVYSRGQDSAGILIYEQSNENIFYRNSATHSGDGFFLWAGQTTMDTGEGGCNGNRIWNNDFSYAPTNGIEVTFSSNHIADNRITGCDHGIWGGYSYNTLIKGNKFRGNRIAIAIEHGQNNKIINNLFLEDREAIRLWSRKEQPADWMYAKKHDTRSIGYLIALNSFNKNRFAFNFRGTDSLQVFGNTFGDCDSLFTGDSSSMAAIDTTSFFIEDTTLGYPFVKDAKDPFKGGGRLAGRKNIMMTQWGPYDFRYPILWNTNPADTSGQMHFSVLGPKGKWKMISVKGVSIDQLKGDSLPMEFTAKKIPQPITDIEIIAEYRGAAFDDPFGNKIAAGKPYRFAFRRFFQPIDFKVKWFAFDSASNPITNSYQQKINSSIPFKTSSVNQLNYAWWGGINRGDSTYSRFMTLAEGKAAVDSGLYELSVTWDDAVRVYVDGKMVLDEWNPALYKFDESPNRIIPLKLEAGLHEFRVEHVELGGFATLSLKLQKQNPGLPGR